MPELISYFSTMDFPETTISRPYLHNFLTHLSPPPFKFLSPYRCITHQLFCGNVSKVALFLGNSDASRTYPVTSSKKGRVVANHKDLGEVVWIVEADLTAGQVLYITGDPTVLGCWEPERAILMSRTEDSNLWTAVIKIIPGVSFKYNYFIKGKSGSSSDIIWRPGPKVSLSVPPFVSEDGKVVVRDCWSRYHAERLPAHVWGSWLEEMFLPQPSAARDEYKVVVHPESDTKDPQTFSNDLSDKHMIQFDDEIMPDATLEDLTPVSNRGFSEREQPVEEPWFLDPSILLSKDDTETDVSGENDTALDKVEQLNNSDQRCEVTELLLDEASLSAEDSVSTTILINSSICTMQRIAVLEDEKLVELLLEPVKNNVQCDSVYLGVVTKLVPHMGGAFVNIGSSRHSLMDIKHNREPFIFPPFRRKSRKQVNGSVSGNGDYSAGHHNDQTPTTTEDNDDIAEVDSQDNSKQFMLDDYQEMHADNDFDITEILNENINGSVADHDELEADFDDELDEDGNNLGGEAKSDRSQTPVQVMKFRSLASENKWTQVRKGTKIIVQVVKEGLGTKSPTLTAYPKLRSRFWVLLTRCEKVGVSKKISGVERTRLRVIAKSLQPEGFGVTVRTVAAGHSLDELQKDLEGLVSTWKSIVEHAKSAALAADEGVEGAVPILLHKPMGQTLSVVQDYFNDKVKQMVVDSPRTYHEVTNYLQEIAPNLCERVELYSKRTPLFDEFKVEEEINNILSKRVPLRNGGSLVIEQTEALVSIDVNGGHGMFGKGTSPEKANLEVNLAAAKQIARELRLRDIGGIIVVDFIDMEDESNKRLVYEEVKKAVERDRSMVKVSELSRHGLMEITRKRVRPSVTFMISEPCGCCHATGRVEALETSFSKIEQEICRLLATIDHVAVSKNPKSWPRFILRVDNHMCEYLTQGKKTRLAVLSSALRVWILLKVARGFTRGEFEVKPFVDEKGTKNQHQVAISMLQRAEARSNSSGKSVIIVPVKKYKSSKK